MYFWTALLLFLTFTFTCCMQPSKIPSKTKGDYVPFNYKYTRETEKFLARMTEDFKTSITGELKMKLFSALSRYSFETRSKFYFRTNYIISKKIFDYLN